MDEATDLVVSYGGSLSGEHGDGQSRGRVPAEDVRRHAVPGVPRVQGDLGPRREDEPRQEDRRLPHHRQLAARGRLQPAAAAHTLRLPEGQGIVRPGDPPVRRRRRVPPRGRADHVPELHGDARGEALDPRAGPPALGDDERRGADRRLAGGGGQGRARPVPGVQGVQARLPGERGRGHVQGRVPVALLRRPRPPAARLLHGPDRPVGPARSRRPRGRQLLQSDAGAQRRREVARRDRPRAADAAVRHGDVQGLVLRRRRETGTAGGR